MKITDVITYVAKAYVGKPVTGFRGFYEDVASKISHGFTAVYVKVITDEGLIGWGEAIKRLRDVSMTYKRPMPILAHIGDLFLPNCLGIYACVLASCLPN